ncbi:MAG: hypothetical protein KIS96_09380 [Bauldia sp.]|nr:hypothetical protein [Bauldia sp.]
MTGHKGVLLRAANFAAVYAAMVAAAFVGGAFLIRRGIDGRLGTAIILFTLGAFIAGFAAALLHRRWSRGRPATARFALAFLLLAILTVAFDVLLFFVQYASYYAQWWPGFPWVLFTATFTGLGVAFYYGTLALPLLLPLGVPLLFAASWYLARLPTPLIPAQAGIQPQTPSPRRGLPPSRE